MSAPEVKFRTAWRDDLPALVRLLAIVLATAAAHAWAQWTPPPAPDPSAILNEASEDARAGRLADALAKHLWFHRNALSYRESLYGVRLSFALASWLELAERYPPALSALRGERDASVLRLHAGKGAHGDFHDVSSINEYLGEQAATARLFAWLDANRPELAKSAYRIAQRALVSTRDYALCGKYLEPERDSASMLELYRLHQRMVASGQFGEDLRDFARQSLANAAGTLVALLAVNERGAEADRVMAAVLKEVPDEELRKALGEARKGSVPAPWPPRQR
jgi:hypothetical protein